MDKIWTNLIWLAIHLMFAVGWIIASLAIMNRKCPPTECWYDTPIMVSVERERGGKVENKWIDAGKFWIWKNTGGEGLYFVYRNPKRQDSVCNWDDLVYQVGKIRAAAEKEFRAEK